MNYNLYFHDDFDGMTSGAVLLDFLRGRGDTLGEFHPLQHGVALRKAWPDFEFHQPSIIVDFLYHPRADWWFDHHPTSFTQPEWQTEYHDGNMKRFDPSYKSCCGLVYKYLCEQQGYQPSAHMAKLIGYADMVDSADYPSAHYVIEAQSPALRFIALFYALKDANDFDYGHFIDQLATHDIEDIIATEKYKLLIDQSLQNSQDALAKLPELMQYQHGVIFVDTTGYVGHMPRFAEYYLHPDALYSVVMKKSDTDYHLSVGKNPWNEAAGTAHIGQILAGYGGGGHAYAGGVERKTLEEISTIAREVIEKLK